MALEHFGSGRLYDLLGPSKMPWEVDLGMSPLRGLPTI
jgi:hypothetical protein